VWLVAAPPLALLLGLGALAYLMRLTVGRRRR
jgi:hypothetical protein